MSREVYREFYYQAAVFFKQVVIMLPYHSAIMVGGLLGALSYYAIPKARRIAIENLSLSFPEKSDDEIRTIARESFINQGKNLFEVFSFPALSESDFRGIVEIENKDVLKRALARGKGVILAGAHCGNWEILGVGLVQCGFPLSVMARRIYIEKLNQMLLGFRTSKGIKIILRSGKESARQILRCIRGNEIMGLLIDQDTAVPGGFVDFFGRPAWTPSGLVTLALKTEATVVLALDRRVRGDKHKGSVIGPLVMVRTGDEKKDVLVNTQFVTRLIEAHIRKYPEQWVWMHQRWKTQPTTVTP